MTQAGIDQVAAVKASLELMVAENGEVHEYFSDLLERVARLDEETPEQRREKFQDLVSMGAFRFNGVDIRHFTKTPQRPLPPPLFLSRTKRRLKNTLTLIGEFEQRGVFALAPELRQEIDQLASHIVNEEDHREVRAFRDEVENLRGSALFRSYLETKNDFIRKDAELRGEAEYLAAKETVEEGEELYRQRGEELDELSRQIESGDMDLDEAQARLDAMSIEAGPDAPDAPDAPDTEEGAALTADVSEDTLDEALAEEPAS